MTLSGGKKRGSTQDCPLEISSGSEDEGAGARATFDGPGYQASKSSGGEVSWACGVCLRFNGPKAKKCSSCSAPRGSGEEDQGFSACWTCPSCNYEYNPDSLKHCGKCAAYRPIDPREIQQQQPVWKSNFGRPTPSTRRASIQPNSLVDFHTGGDGAYAASNTIRALEFFRNTLPRHQRELKLRRQFSARSSDAVEAVDLQPLSREAAPKMLRMLELGMRKAGAGAAGLADSPLARGPDDRETRFGTRSEWADFAEFAQERKGKDHAYERAKAEKAMAESGDGWRPGAHDEALDSLLDRFDDDDDPIVMRKLAPTPEVTFDVADMPEAPPDGRPLLFVGPPPGGRPIIGGRPGTSAAPRAETADARVAQYSPTPSPLRPGTTASQRRAQTSSPTWYGDAREGEAKRMIRIKAKTRGGSRRRAARVSKVRANMRANTFSNRVSRQSKKGAGGQFFK